MSSFEMTLGRNRRQFGKPIPSTGAAIPCGVTWVGQTTFQVNVDMATPEFTRDCYDSVAYMREAGVGGDIDVIMNVNANPSLGQAKLFEAQAQAKVMEAEAHIKIIEAQAQAKYMEAQAQAAIFTAQAAAFTAQNGLMQVQNGGAVLPPQIMNVPAPAASQTAALEQSQAQNAQLVQQMAQMQAQFQAQMAQMQAMMQAQTPQTQPIVQTQPTVQIVQAQTQPVQVVEDPEPVQIVQAQFSTPVQIVQPTVQTQSTVQTTETLSQYQGALTTNTQALTNHVMNVITGNIPVPPPPPPTGYIPQKKEIGEAEVSKLAGALGKMNLNPAAATAVKPQADGHAELMKAIRKRGQANDGATPVESVEDKVNRQKAEKAAADAAQTLQGELQAKIAVIAAANGHQKDPTDALDDESGWAS